MKFGKRLPSGGSVNPGRPSGYQPYLQALTPEQEQEDYEQYARAFSYAQQDLWPDFLFTDWGVEPEVPEPLVQVIRDHQASLGGVSTVAACADLVHMDEPVELAQQYAVWARSKNLSPALRHTLCAKPDFDFIGRYCGPTEFMQMGLTGAMRWGFAEKDFWQVVRPEEQVRELTGLGPAVSTAYPEGCPCHPERPAGHGIFAGFLSKRAGMYYNGDGVDQLFMASGAHLSLWRVLAGMHRPRSCMEGKEMGATAATWMPKELDDTYALERSQP